MSNITFGRGLLLIIVTCSVFLTGLGEARLWDRDEPRNSGASREMLARGDVIVPTFNGELRAHKPILIYWSQMACYKLFGESEFSARLPSALSAILSVLAVAVLASRLSGHATGISQEGFWAAGSLATCLMFVLAGRAATPDGLLIAFSTLGISLLVLSCLAPAAPYSSGGVRSARWLLGMSGYVMLGIAALAKGPVGVILPIGVVSLWWLFNYELQVAQNKQKNAEKNGILRAIAFTWRAINPVRCFYAAWQLKLVPGLLLTAAVCVPWYYQVGVATDGEFLRGFFLEHNVGRAVNSMEGHGGSIFFYPVAFLAGTFPWSLWLVPVTLWAIRSAKTSVVHRQLVILTATWIGVYITAFSIASTKLPSYITPCYAGAALALGGYLRHFEIGWSLPAAWQRWGAYAFAVVSGVGIAAGLYYVAGQESMPLVERASLCGLAIAVAGVVAIAWDLRKQVKWVPLTWLVAAAGFQTLLFGFGAKSVDQYRGDLQLLSQADVDDATPWMTIGGMEPSWVFYLRTVIDEVGENPTDEVAWERVATFLEQHPKGRVIVVGDEAKQQLDARLSQILPSGRQLVELGSSARFLREGKLSVVSTQEISSMRIADSSPMSVEADANETDSTSELEEAPVARTASLPSFPEIPSLPVSDSSDSPPALNDDTDVSIEISAPQTQSKSAKGSSGYPNPLRTEDR